jgi:hypothetical protein
VHQLPEVQLPLQHVGDVRVVGHQRGAVRCRPRQELVEIPLGDLLRLLLGVGRNGGQRPLPLPWALLV